MRPGRARLGLVAALLWAALLFWQSSSTGAGSFLDFLPAGSDKVAHFAAYAVLGALITLATGTPLAGWVLATLYGISDEIHQAFVPGRFPSLGDLAADALGAALGAWLVAYLVRRSKRTNLE